MVILLREIESLAKPPIFILERKDFFLLQRQKLFHCNGNILQML